MTTYGDSPSPLNKTRRDATEGEIQARRDVFKGETRDVSGYSEEYQKGYKKGKLDAEFLDHERAVDEERAMRHRMGPEWSHD